MNRRTLAAALAIAAALALLILWIGSNRGGRDTDVGTPSPPDASNAAADDPPGRRIPPGAARNRPLPEIETGDPSVDFDVRELLANFRELTRFPPDSRPLGPEQVDLLEPNRRHEGVVAVTTPVRGQPYDPEAVYYVHFTGDRYFVTGKETLRTTIRVWKGTKGTIGEPITIDSATLVATTPAGEQDLGDVTYRQVRGPDGITYVNAVSPAVAGAVVVGEHRILLHFTAPDGAQAEGRLDFFYTPAGGVPARFTGRFRERLENGSLVIAADVEVSRGGRYEIDANLFDEEQRPVASAHATAQLEPGKRSVDLLFFGLIFHEKRATGRFTLRDLRGHRFSPGELPDREMMPAHGGEFRTAKTYALDDFSDAEYDSPDKQQQVKMYEDEIRRQEETR